MYLQLAENEEMSAGAPATTKPYIFIPNGGRSGRGMYVREDFFDALPDNEYKVVMSRLLPHQREVQRGMSESMYLSNKANRKQRRADKHDKKQSKIELRKAKGEAKVTRAQKKGSGAGKEYLDKAIDVAGGLIGGRKGGGSGDDTAPTSWYKTTPGMVGIGAGVLLLVGGIVVLTRKKK